MAIVIKIINVPDVFLSFLGEYKNYLSGYFKSENMKKIRWQSSIVSSKLALTVGFYFLAY
ncbi:hypothetical protein [Pectobacterium versatile]|uniref:hypothetical protein n=1 Tax=Pectobacterium versatile TaxID=2488639 RepID=UPI00193690D1|nr:hypothetical protein [Pectobacterium versatile]QQK73253.1 hypothetical protein HG702_18855 [Pectobacterium versatile]